ncbi:MAG TPA: carbamoyl-phosphate synthase domain-containing protein, partial [Bacteroidales bacterium]|nr:carbamoyl-phosphate synthase domain-containing protein [Bacteroidales bacterium]
MNKKLVLEDGSEFYGKAFGYGEDVYGEVVFTTSMSGYQELLTDPSLLGQMLVMTYPMIGNYGINRDDYESMKPHLSALIVREYCDAPSNFRSEKSLLEYMDKYRLPGLYGVDTRMLTRHIREKGALKGAILPAEMPLEDCLLEIAAYPFFKDHISRASSRNIYEVPGSGKRVVLMDFGMK